MELEYDEYGSGTPVLLVHGLGGTGNLWGGCVATLARHFRVVCPDLRGSGRSACEGEISTPALTADLLAFMDRLKIDQAHCVGHSYGTVLLQHLAVGNPGRVRSLSLLGPIHAPAEAARKALAGRAATAHSEGLKGIADATVQAGTSAETKAHRPEVAAFVREMVMRQSAQGYAMTCEAVAGTQAAAVESLRCATLVVTGDEDATSPPLVAKALADKIAGSRFHVLPRCGHWMPVEHPRPLTELLFNFLIAN
jgi:pimeloyl-ACP methyl ester carboxylesterase